MGFAMRARCDMTGPPAAVGIDLGTKNARVATWQDGDVVVIPNDRGKLATPAVVAFTDNGVLVGEAAADQACSNLENTIFAPTRLIGSKFENPWIQLQMSLWPSSVVKGSGDKPMLRVKDKGAERLVSPEELVTALVDYLRRMAERFLGTRVAEAVVTMPAQYGPQQSAALVEAVEAARLRVRDLVKAPTAAGMAFCQMNPRLTRQTLLICDVGGSYFDFSLLGVEEGQIVERAVGTDFLDLDATLLRYSLRDLRERYSMDISSQQLPMHRLRMSCEVARRKLAQFHQAWIEVKDLTDGMDYCAGISRTHFEDHCSAEVQSLLEPIDWCLEDCNLGRADVEVVLVGGNARVPQVRRLMRTFFYGRAPHEVIRPDHAAVLGAAVYSALLCDRATTPNGSAAPAPSPGESRPKHIDLRQVNCPTMTASAPPPSSAAAANKAPAERPPLLSSAQAGLPPVGTDGDPDRHSEEEAEEMETAPSNEAVGGPKPLRCEVPRPSAFRVCQARRILPVLEEKATTARCGIKAPWF